MNKGLNPKNFLLEMAKMREKDPEKAFAFALENGKTFKNPQTRQAALYFAAVGLFSQARYEKAEALLKSFIFVYQKYPFEPFYINCFDLLGLIEFYKQRFRIAIFYLEQALALELEKKRTDRLASIYSNLSAPYNALKENEKCLEYLDKALSYVDENGDPEIKTTLTYNRSAALVSLGRYQEAKAAVEEVERLAKDLPVFPILADILPICKAEISLSMNEPVDLHPLALTFLSLPYQNDPRFFSYVLDDDEALFTLLRKYGSREDALLCLKKIEDINAQSPFLFTAIFIAKSKIALAHESGDALEEGKHNAELCRLYEKQNESLAKDFEEITQLHFDFVRVANAYKKVRKRASHLLVESDTDVLTTLANRRALEKDKRRFPLLAQKKPYFVLALLDYDHFKEINDIHGYQSGDQALHLGGVLFKSVESPTRRVFRYGGDEFLFALAFDSPQEAASFFNVLKSQLEAIDFSSSEGVKIPLSCCIGYGLFHGTYENYNSALKAVTEAIHAAKKIGKGNIVSLVC